jgi:acyl-CoA dehydrogenase
MHLKLDEERALLQDTVRSFAKEQVRPHARAWEERGSLDAKTLDTAWQLGFAAMGVSESYGGAADKDAVPSALTNAIVLEELAWADLGFALAAFSPMHVVIPIALGGHEHLKREVLPALAGSPTLPKATGAWVEPARLADGLALSARATSTQQGPTLTGRKTLAPRVDDAEMITVCARTRPGDDAGAFEPFLVLGKNVSGMTRGKRQDVIGPHAVPLCELVLDDAPAKRVGEKLGQLYAPMLERALIGQAAAGLGVARAACEYAVEYARDRRAFGRAIAQNQGIAFKLAEAAMDVEGARWLLWKAAWKVDRVRADGGSALAEAAQAQRFATDLAFKVADDCVQILGGHGVIRDHLAELFFRNSRTLSSTTGWFIA